ncbi:MAG TPA: Stk1 family PASTA domain-containing Ser/Thr kinase [Propionibacteriaceae bacterium]|nr:Stk1 family PASTA domain-containing Ser/Thr kinase [Propionibacteriaceae bacterium]
MTGGPRMVGSRYELGSVLGRGGMAEVRAAVDTRLGRPVAVKLLRADLATDPTFQARFRREAQSAAGLNHPTIVAVYDTGEDTDAVTGVSIPYIVMELVEGQTLRDVLREGRKILPERALELTQGVLDALSYSHQAGIVHRDIKPANVMLTPNGGIKVMDFGIARAVADTSATMTQTAAVIGTAQYLSPEQARGETVDARSDIYSAGCLLYELLVGRPPFIGDSPVSVAYQHVRELPLPPSQVDPVISSDVDAVTLTALAKDPADRYQSAREMKADIGRVLAGQRAGAAAPRGAPGDSATRALPRPVAAAAIVDDSDEQPRRSRAGLAVLISVLILSLLGGGAYAAYQYLNPAPVAPQVAMVTVPAVLGNTQAEADSNLRNAGLNPTFKNVNGESDETANTAVKQNPPGGASVAANTTVLVEINVGPRTATVPNNLVGEDKDKVARQLTSAGFKSPKLVKAPSEPVTARKDEVLTVLPGEGEIVALDGEITVTYATGSSPVPVLTGRLLSQARSDAEAAGFDVRSKKRVSDQPTGIVIAQSPPPGKQLARSSRITVTVAAARPAPEPTTKSPEPPEPPPATDSPEPSPTSPSPTPSASAASPSDSPSPDG